MKALLAKPLAKYLVVGTAAFIVEYGTFFGMYVELHWPLYLANSISFGLGLFTSFCLNRLWTFSHKSYNKKAAHQLSFYIVLALINLLLTNLIVAWFKHLGVNPRIGKIGAMLITSLWNYILFKLLIFTHTPADKLPAGNDTK